MRTAAVLLGALVLAAIVAHPPVAAAEVVPTKAALVACRPAPEAYAVIAAQMGARAGVTQMQLRFDVLRRAAGAARFVPVTGAGLSEWISSAPGVKVDIFRFRKQVANLAPGADYRVVVRFRWLAGETVVRRAQRVTRVCRQPDRRPDLAVAAIRVEPVPGTFSVRVVVAVRNHGRRASGPVGVGLAVGSSAPPAQTLPRVLRGARREVAWIGPPCPPGTVIRAVADPGALVNEPDEADNVRSITC